jgi:hypothetical protein
MSQATADKPPLRNSKRASDPKKCISALPYLANLFYQTGSFVLTFKQKQLGQLIFQAKEKLNTYQRCRAIPSPIRDSSNSTSAMSFLCSDFKIALA